MKKRFIITLFFLLAVPKLIFAMSCEDLFKTSNVSSPHIYMRSFLKTIDPIDVMREATQRYPELSWLTGRVDATPFGKSQIDGKSISEKIFGSKHIEFDRTSTGILLLKWILEGNYKTFTAPQNSAQKMSRDNFKNLRAYTRSILKTPEDVDAMITYMVINDLGKIKSIAEDIQNRAGIKEIDHDNLLLLALEKYPEISPSFSRLSQEHRRWIIDSLRPKFNIGQFLQGEGLPANLIGLKGVDPIAMDFYLLHAIADIGGVAGHVNSHGSVIMNEPFYNTFKAGLISLESFAKGTSEIEVYNDFLRVRGEPLGLSIQRKRDRALLRIAMMLKISENLEIQDLNKAYDSLSTKDQAILTKEMNVNGTNDGLGILLYYSPALLLNIVSATKIPNSEIDRIESFQIGLKILARLYQESRRVIAERSGNGVFTVLISDVAELGKINPRALLEKKFTIEVVGNDGRVKILD